jgi:hypothetical protein
MNTRVIQDEWDAPAPPAAPGPSPRLDTRRVLMLAFGGIAVLVALALLAGGGVAVWGLGQRDAAGYFTSATHRISTPSYALATESLDVDADAPSWVFGDRFATARVQARSTQPVFIGIGRTNAVERYLAGVQHDQITDVDTDPFRIKSHRLTGDARPMAPASQGFWRMQASGPGTRTITWPLEKGHWSAVVMNADGSRGVAIDARIGARVPFVRWIAIGLLATGGLVLLFGGALIYLGARRPRPAREEG